MEKFNTDLVIIGAGGAGLPAALTAQENDIKDIVLLEKRFATGGEAQYAGGMIFATGTRHQKQKGWYLSPDDKFLKAIEFCHYDIVKPEILRTYIDKTVTNIDWIEKTSGVEYECVSCNGQPSMDNTTHVPVGLDRPTMSFSKVTLQWVKRFKENGGKVLTNTDGISIINDGGRAVGVMARTRDGRDIEIKAKAVIIATGCFSKNNPLMHQRFPDRYPASSDAVDQRPVLRFLRRCPDRRRSRHGHRSRYSSIREVLSMQGDRLLLRRYNDLQQPPARPGLPRGSLYLDQQTRRAFSREEHE